MMKKILITGENSYVGNSLAEWLEQYPTCYSVDKISMRGESWKTKDFSIYDAVVHVAGIAHVSTDPNMEEKYYKVNRDLTIEAAQKAKAEGVRQFIFLSSIIVYGENIANNGIIDKHTVPAPSNFYGNSKLQAEKGIDLLADEHFNVAIIRPPMIYGKGSKGNYPKLANVAQKLPIFPDIDNQRSMLHIDNLSEFLKLMIDHEENGLFFPQNKEYVKTSEMVKLIAEVHGKKIKLVKLFNPILRIMISRVGIMNKVFGDLVYEKELCSYHKNYHMKDLSESIVKTEAKSSKQDNIDILLMADNCLETVGGEQESTKIIINGIKKEFTLGVIQPGNIENPTVGVHYYPMTSETRIKHLVKHPLSFMKYIWDVKKKIRKQKPKIIHTQAQVSFFIVALLRKFKLVSKDIKLIHTERGLYTKYGKVIKGLFHFFMKELDVLVTTTEFNMKYWKDAIQQKGLQLEFKIIENTAGELFEIYDEEHDEKDENNFVLGFAGRYADWKNWPLAVEISKKLNQQLGHQLHVQMAVGCLDENSEKETQKMFHQMSEIFGARFTGQINIDLQTMDQFYYNIDAFILTSNYNTESFGRTLVEAMSRRTVVLSTDAGGSVEVVGDLENVYKSADEFIERLLFFYSNRNIMEKEKEANMQRVKKKYSLKNNIDKHLEMYANNNNMV